MVFASAIPVQDVVLFAVFTGGRQDETCSICWTGLPAPAVIERKPRDSKDGRIFPAQPDSVGNNVT